MTQELLNLGCTFWGVDPSSRMIEIARERGAETRVLDANAIFGLAGRP